MALVARPAAAAARWNGQWTSHLTLLLQSRSRRAWQLGTPCADGMVYVSLSCLTYPGVPTISRAFRCCVLQDQCFGLSWIEHGTPPSSDDGKVEGGIAAELAHSLPRAIFVCARPFCQVVERPSILSTMECFPYFHRGGDAHRCAEPSTVVCWHRRCSCSSPPKLVPAKEQKTELVRLTTA